MDNIKTGELIRQCRKEKGMTQKDLAEKLHITDRAVSKWERGLCAPDISMLEPLSEVLEVSILELMYGERKAAEEKQEEVEVSVKEVIRYSEKDTARKTKKLKGKLILRFAVAIALVISLFLTYFSFTGDGYGWSCIPGYFGALEAGRALESYEKEAIEVAFGYAEENGLYNKLISLKERGAVITDVNTKLYNVKLDDMLTEVRMDFAVTYEYTTYRFSVFGEYKNGKIELKRIFNDLEFDYPAEIHTLSKALATYYPG